MYRSIGRGEPPLSISTSSESLRCSQAGAIKTRKTAVLPSIYTAELPSCEH